MAFESLSNLNQQYNPVARVRDYGFSTESAGKPFELETPEGMTRRSLDTPIGEIPTWERRQNSNIWVIATHGITASLDDTLPIMGAAEALGVNGLAITHRNHAGAPKTGKGRARYAVDGIEEPMSAIEYAIEEGAEQIYLDGISLGGAIMSAAMLAEIQSGRGIVRALMTHAGELDLKTEIQEGVITGLEEEVFGKPTPRLSKIVAGATTGYIGLRDSIRWGKVNYAEQLIARLDRPMFISHGDTDSVVSIERSRMLATARPDVVTLVEYPDHEHVVQWRESPEQYASVRAQFLEDTIRTAR